MGFLHEFIQSMEKRPLMYLNDYNIDVLRAYLQGYFGGRYETNNLDEDDESFGNFSFWVQEYYGEELTSHGWASVILYHEGSHRKAVEKFFELYKEWYENPENRLKTYV